MTRSFLLTVLALLPAKGAVNALPEYPLDERGLQIRADYYTEGGKYLGGIPTYDDAHVLYSCTELNFDNAYNATVGIDTTCISWTANVEGSSENELGRCSCQSVMNAEYCDAWTCSDLDVFNNDEPCPGSEDITSSCAGVETVVHSTRCVCETGDDSGNFCSSWVCLESDYEFGREYGEYECVSASRAGTYCEAWTGVAENSDEAYISSCACSQELESSRVCLQWECEVRSMTKCSKARPGWCNIGFSIGIGGFLGSLGAVLVALGLYRHVKKGQPFCGYSCGLCTLLGFAWMSAWSIGVVVWGGVDGVLCAALWWGVVIVIGMLSGCFHKLFSS